jgi:hypothetical protein
MYVCIYIERERFIYPVDNMEYVISIYDKEIIYTYI